MKSVNRFWSVVLPVLLLLSLILVGSFTVSAETVSGVTGACTWRLDGTVLTISGNGPMSSYYWEGYAPWGTSITKVVIEEGVTTIGGSAFNLCHDLKDISISSTVEMIEENAFNFCDGLEEVVLPEGLKRIEKNAFIQCHSLKSIFIPASVNSMGTNPFQWCSELTNIEVAEENAHFFSEGNCLIERSPALLFPVVIIALFRKMPG